jgi:hypothetical protein
MTDAPTHTDPTRRFRTAVTTRELHSMRTTCTTHTTATHRRRGIAARAATLAGAVVAVCGLGLAWAGPASAASTVNGTAVIASPGVTTPLTSGGSATPFTVALPAQAACDGDTASGGYHVYSYMVHQGASVTTAAPFTLGPSSGLGLFDNVGTYYGPVNTAIGTGQIVSIPNNFQWAALVSGGNATLAQLLYSGSGSTASGSWEVGLVCANTTGAVADNWGSPITFNASLTDPTGFTWTATPAGSSAPVITSAATATFAVGTITPFDVTATGNPTPNITESGTLPAGVTFTPGATGVLHGNPTAPGSFPITFTATNGIGSPATQSFTLKVQAATTPTTTTTTTTNPTLTTTSTTNPGGQVAPATAPSSGGSTGDPSTGTGSTGSTGSDPTLAFTGFHTATGLGLGLLGVGLGLMLLGWGYRTKIRPARRARESAT